MNVYVLSRWTARPPMDTAVLGDIGPTDIVVTAKMLTSRHSAAAAGAADLTNET